MSINGGAALIPTDYSYLFNRWLYQNELTGPLPVEWSSLTKLEDLYVPPACLLWGTEYFSHDV